jgi:hypothetical protein
MATAMVIVAMTLTVKVLGYVAQERRLADHRQRALHEAASVIERLTAIPYDELTPERAGTVGLSPSARRSLPGAELFVNVDESRPSTGQSAQRIRIRLRWKGRTGEWDAPIRLTTWRERRRMAP